MITNLEVFPVANADKAYSLGEAVEIEFEATLAEFERSIRWRGSRDELLAEPVLRVEQDIVRSRGGIFGITTRVLARRSSEDMVGYNRYTISGTWRSSHNH